MTAAERRRLVALSKWTDREWAIFAMGYEAGCELARRATWDALTNASRTASKAKQAVAALHEHPTSIHTAILRAIESAE